MLNEEDAELRALALSACAIFLSRRKGLALVEPYLQSEEPALRRAALLSLAQLRAPGLSERLIQDLQRLTELADPDPQQMKELMLTLQAIQLYREPVIGEQLLQSYRRWLRSLVFNGLRKEVIEIAATLGGEASLALLVEAMGDPVPTLRRLAERKLRRLQTRLAQ